MYNCAATSIWFKLFCSVLFVLMILLSLDLFSCIVGCAHTVRPACLTATQVVASISEQRRP